MGLNKKVRSFYLTDEIFKQFCHLVVDLDKNYNDTLEELMLAYKNSGGDPYDTIAAGYGKK